VPAVGRSSSCCLARVRRQSSSLSPGSGSSPSARVEELELVGRKRVEVDGGRAGRRVWVEDVGGEVRVEEGMVACEENMDRVRARSKKVEVVAEGEGVAATEGEGRFVDVDCKEGEEENLVVVATEGLGGGRSKSVLVGEPA
jgi:hypothetical protein